MPTVTPIGSNHPRVTQQLSLAGSSDAIDFHTSVLVPARTQCHISASRFVIEMTGSKPSDLTRS
jgi:hypothetical protein